MRPYIVVGGGIAGLTAANALALRGHQVTLLEQSSHLGGRAMTQRDGGYSFNLGPHALYAGGRAKQTFDSWEIPLPGRPPIYGDRTFMVAEGNRMPFLSTPQSVLTSTWLNLEEKQQALQALSSIATSVVYAGEAMGRWIDGQASSIKVRQLLATITRVSTYTGDVDHLDANAALAQIRMAREGGVLYLDGGWQTMVDGLALRARQLGVKIRCGQPVAHLEDLGPANVILAVPPAAVQKITGATLPATRPIRMACLNLGLRGLPADAPTFALGLDQPMYYSLHSAAARLTEDPDTSVVHVGKYLSARPDDPVAARKELEAFTDILLPGWRDRTEAVYFLPDMVVTHAAFSPEGRPPSQIAGFDHLALAGDWVGQEGMLADAAVASGLEAARILDQGREQAA